MYPLDMPDSGALPSACVCVCVCVCMMSPGSFWVMATALEHPTAFCCQLGGVVELNTCYCPFRPQPVNCTDIK
jgi:hypothetical protein